MAIFENKDDIFELIDKFDKSSLSELEMAFGADLNVKLSKSQPRSDRAVYISEKRETPALDDFVPAKKPEVYEEFETSDNINNSKIITSPLVGTFYSSSSPDSEAYAEVGDKITKGMVLCIIEAMKTMNEIESETDGEIAEVLAKNGSPVEYGQPLFRLK